MVKISIFGRSKGRIAELKKKLKTYQLTASENADIMISLGGDGTYLLAERRFPGLPKLLVRDRSVCYRCNKHSFHEIDTLLNRLKNNKFSISNHIKLEATANNRKLIGVNDMIIRNKKQNCALRFSLEVNNKIKYKEVVGDGVVFSTPFGSTGYFYSITRKSFDKGIGIAFNNSVVGLKPIISNDNSRFQIRITRGSALVSADNNEKMILVKEGQSISIKKHKYKAKIVTF